MFYLSMLFKFIFLLLKTSFFGPSTIIVILICQKGLEQYLIPQFDKLIIHFYLQITFYFRSMRSSAQSSQSQKFKRNNQLKRLYSRSKSKDNLENKTFSKFYVKDVCSQAKQRSLDTNSLILNTQKSKISPRNDTFKLFGQKRQDKVCKNLSLKQINLSSLKNRSLEKNAKYLDVSKPQYQYLNSMLNKANKQMQKLKNENEILKRQNIFLRGKLNREQSELASNQNSLNRFKKAVKTNRISQLQDQNRKNRIRISQLSEKNNSMKIKIDNLLNQLCISNKSEYKNEQIILMSDSGNSNMTEYLQQSQKQYYKAKQEIKKLHLQLDNQKRRKQMQIQNYIKMKDGEYLQLKHKHLNLLEKFKKVKKQHNFLLIKRKREQSMKISSKEGNIVPNNEYSTNEISLQVSQDQIQF